MSLRVWPVALLIACGVGTSPSNPVASPDPGDDDDASPPETTGDTGTPVEDTVPWDCYARIVVAYAEPQLEGEVGLEGWDPASNLPIGGQLDVGADGVFETFWTYEHDDLGNVSAYTYDDGSEPYAESYVWSETGRRLTYALDEGIDGTLDYAVYQGYDEDDNRVLYEVDGDGDGDVDLRYVYVYVDGGLTHQTSDYDADGIPEAETAYVSDDLGRLRSAEFDDGADGSVEFTYTWTYTDPVLRVGTLTEYPAPFVSPDLVVDFAFDANRRQLRYDRDEGVDGVFESENAWTYFEDGSVATYDWYMSPTYSYGYGVEVVGHESHLRDGRDRPVEDHVEQTLGDLVDATTTTRTYGGTCP